MHCSHWNRATGRAVAHNNVARKILRLLEIPFALEVFCSRWEAVWISSAFKWTFVPNLKKEIPSRLVCQQNPWTTLLHIQHGCAACFLWLGLHVHPHPNLKSKSLQHIPYCGCAHNLFPSYCMHRGCIYCTVLQIYDFLLRRTSIWN